MKNKPVIRASVWFQLSYLIMFVTSCSQKASDSEAIFCAEAVKIEPLFNKAEIKNDQGNELPYRYFEPSVKEGDSAKYPVILFLHGEEATGTDNEIQLKTTECATIWVESDHLALNPAYVLAPQIPEGSNWTSDPVYSQTLALLNRFVEEHPKIDKNRIYVVGFSMGATGVWNLILKNPNLFACAMPISGNADAYLGDPDAWKPLKNMPVFFIHSYDDPVSPISGSLNALAALEIAGNKYTSSSATRCLWQPGSTPSPHHAWWTAFHKFEVVYNSLFEHNLERTRHGAVSPTELYTKKDLGDGITRIWDYALSTCHVIEREDKAILVDVMMGQGDLLQYVRDNVLKNKDIDLEVFVTHNDNDHIYGLRYFIGSSQLKKVYLHEKEREPVEKILGADASKMQFIKDGDLIPIGGESSDVILVPGHSIGHTILRYKNYLFPGDAIGTGYVGVGDISTDEYIPFVQHLLDKMGNEPYTILAGHTGECRIPLNEKYVFDLLACAKGLSDGSIPSKPYWRNARYVATYGEANITHDLNNKRERKGALLSLTLSEGTMSPQFVAWLNYYKAIVDHNVSTLTITPVVRADDYASLTINGEVVKSRVAHPVNLVQGENRFVVEVTSLDNQSRKYTLTINRGE